MNRNHARKAPPDDRRDAIARQQEYQNDIDIPRLAPQRDQRPLQGVYLRSFREGLRIVARTGSRLLQRQLRFRSRAARAARALEVGQRQCST